MKFKLNIFISFLALMCSCVNNGSENSYSYNDTLPAPIEGSEEVVPGVPNTMAQIRIPERFDPTIPLTEEIKQTSLHDMVLEKYYSFQNPKNRRKHKSVLQHRVVNGVIDLTQGGPLSYEEMWELGEQRGHTLREYFFDAAYIDKWTGAYAAIMKEPTFITRSEDSNLAKVYFMQDFSGFVHYNQDYCSNIIDVIESNESDEQLRRAQNHQKLYD